jgi:hypothetical protein
LFYLTRSTGLVPQEKSDASILTQLASEAQLNCVCDYIGKVDVLDNNTAVVEAIDNAEEAKTANNNEIQASTKNSDNHKCVAAADNFNNISGSGVVDDNLDEIAVELLQMMEEENFPLATVVMDHEPPTPKSQLLWKISLVGKKVSTNYVMMSR